MKTSSTLSSAHPRVLVVGDAMLDRYWDGSVERISPEAPVPVLQITEQSERAGGAANVALNLARLGGKVCLLSLLGEDEAGARVKTLLGEAGVQVEGIGGAGYVTTQKIRCVSQRHQMLRADLERQPAPSLQDNLYQRFATLVDGHDLVVLSDYGKGALSQCGRLIRLARQKSMPILVDPKGSDYERYRGATLVKPNLLEFRAVAGSFASQAEFVQQAFQLRLAYGFTHLLVTQGEQGMTLFREDGLQHEPGQRRDVFDVSGAGDTVMATLAFMWASGQPLDKAVRWANVAGGLVVEKFGTSTLSWEELSHAAAPTDLARPPEVAPDDDRPPTFLPLAACGTCHLRQASAGRIPTLAAPSS